MAKRTKTATADATARYLPLDSEMDILAAAERILQSKLQQGEHLTDPSRAGQMFRLRLAHLEREVFSVAFLTNRHQVISVEDLFFGTLDGAEVYPKEVARAALRNNAAAILIAHNHPSNGPNGSEPSAADRAVTLRLKDALALLEIRLLDHFVVSASGATSMASRGWV
jgi:DNA repair protein RadC